MVFQVTYMDVEHVNYYICITSWVVPPTYSDEGYNAANLTLFWILNSLNSYFWTFHSCVILKCFFTYLYSIKHMIILPNNQHF